MSDRKILLVQPDAGVAQQQRKQLEAAGHKVVHVASAREALDSVPRGDFALMMIEYQLPGEIDALETYAHLKAEGYDLPVILVTDTADELVLLKALRAGVGDFFRRTPGYLSFLDAAVNRLLRQARAPAHRIASQSRLAGIIESAKDAIIAINQEQRITLFNPAAEHMFSCPAKDAIAQPITRFLPRELSDAGGISSSVSLSSRIPFQTRGRRNTGEEFPLEATLSRFEVEKRKFYTLMVRDITERVRAEAALQRAYNELERRVQEGTAAVNRAHAEVEQRVKERTSAFEEEFARIAREMHDELGQGLASLKMDMSWLNDKMGTEEASSIQEKINGMGTMIDSMIVAVQRIATDLRRSQA